MITRPVLCAAVLACGLVFISCASTQEAPPPADPAAEQAYIAGLDGCTVQLNDEDGRTILCGQTMGALVLAGKVDSEELVTSFLDGVGKGAGVAIEREAADRDIAGTIASGTHAWFTNANGVLVDGWLGVVTAGGDRRLVGCFNMGQTIGDRCPSMLAVLRDEPLMAAGRYPVDILGARTVADDGCNLVPNRASCGSYELQWYDDGESLPADLFVDRFLSLGSTLRGRSPFACEAGGKDARCEKVQLENTSGNVDIYFAYPAAGGVMLCIVEQDRGLEPLCRAVIRVKEG